VWKRQVAEQMLSKAWGGGVEGIKQFRQQAYRQVQGIHRE